LGRQRPGPTVTFAHFQTMGVHPHLDVTPGALARVDPDLARPPRRLDDQLVPCPGTESLATGPDQQSCVLRTDLEGGCVEVHKINATPSQQVSRRGQPCSSAGPDAGGRAQPREAVGCVKELTGRRPQCWSVASLRSLSTTARTSSGRSWPRVQVTAVASGWRSPKRAQWESGGLFCCRLLFSMGVTSRYLVARDGMTAPLPPGQPPPLR